MNKTTTKLLTALALLIFMTPSLTGWGQTIPETVAYTLDGTQTGGTNRYDTESDITQGGINWKVTGNTREKPWRVGGKNISNAERPIYSTGYIPANVTKIEVTHGTAEQITVNSWTVIVATDASFNTVVNTLTPTFTASTTTTIERPDGADWTNCYYKFVYNVTNSTSTNRYIQFSQAEFYAPAPQLTITPPTGGTITVTDAENNPVTSGDYLAPNATLNIVATPNPRYAFDGWTTTSGTLGNANNPSTTLSLSAIDATLSATFVEAHTLTLHSEHGTITATDSLSNPVISGNYIASGAVLNIVATPASGYEFDGWTVSGTGSSVASSTAATTTFTMGAANAELTASFTLAQGPIYTFVKTSEIAVGDTVLLIYEGDKKELSGFTTSGTIYGKGTTYTTVPAGLYPLTVVQGYSTGTYAFQNSSNAYLYWTNSNSLQTNNTLSNNSSWNVSFSDGNATIANAATSTRTIRWNNSNYGGDRFACYTSGQQAVQLYKKVEMHPITITQPADGNGTIAVFDADQNEVATGDFFIEGELLTIEATPLPGYALDEWTATNGAVGDTHALTTTFTMGTGDAAITASFAADNTPYDINIAQSIANGSVVADHTSCVSGSQVTLTISPDSGYNIESLTVTGFVSGNNIMISPALSLNETEYTFTMPAEAVTINGTFTDRVIDELSIALIYPNMTPYGTSTYYDWTVSNKSNAVYAGNSNHTNQYIQLRNTSPAGIVSTSSGGYVRRVAVSWAGSNTDNRAITVYGKNDPYTGPSDLYNTSTRGTQLGTLTYTTDATSAELEIDTVDYKYVGLLAGNELYVNPVQITWEDPSVSTTIAIDDSGLTNTNIYGDNFAAGSLVATVKDNNDDPISGATVTWASSNTGVATIANDGTVTLYSPGTTTITANYNGVLCQYKPSTATYVLEVINLSPNDPGGVNNPYTVAQAIAATSATGATTAVYVHGTVSSFYGTNIMDGGRRYYINDGGTTDELLVYGGKGMNDVAFSNVSDLLVGDEVTIFGRLANNGTTPEIAANNHIVSLNRTINGNATYNDFTIPNGATFTVETGATLTLSGHSTNNGQLTIEDGGQLIHDNAINATMKKGIAAASDWENVSDGWYTISSSVAGASLATATIGDYDLYRYDEASIQWLNKKNDDHSALFETFEQGIGYLYANSAVQTLEYDGEMVGTDSEVTVPLSFTSTIASSFQGYNLVGNPFSCNLTEASVVKMGDADVDAFLLVENGTELQLCKFSDHDIIKPGQGFFVQTSAACDLVFNPSAKGSRDEAKAKSGFIRIEAGNDSFMDRAYIQIGKGNTLRKMTINDNIAHVYVMQDGKDYAAATIEEAQGEMPVNFVAHEDGTYTLTVKATLNAQPSTFSYLHLIDNIAGIDVDLLANPSYTFNAKNDDYASRFRLVFSSNSMNENEIFAFISNDQLIVNGAGTLQVIDMMGRIISTHQINGTQSVNTAALASGVYVLQLVNGTNVKTQKIVK